MKAELSDRPIWIYPLANPKGVHYFCEVCNQNAVTMCPFCRVTCYCSLEHRMLDWNSIHETICPLLPKLRSSKLPPIIFRGEEANLKQKENLLKHLIELCSIKAQEFLRNKEFDKALPASVHSLHFVNQLRGTYSLDLISPLLLYAESKLGLQKIDQAKILYTQAVWLSKKFPSCPDDLSSKLYRTLARIKFVTKDYEGVCQSASKDVSFLKLSRVYGPLDYRIAGGYFLLAQAFEKLEKTEVARSIYFKVVDLWMNFLTKIIRMIVYKEVNEEESNSNYCLDLAEQAAAKMMLSYIFSRTASPKAAHSLAMLFFFQNKISQALKYGRIALETFNYNFDAENPPYLVVAREFMNYYENRPTSAGSSD